MNAIVSVSIAALGLAGMAARRIVINPTMAAATETDRKALTVPR